jgi:Fe2+ or Zn2+ uptake regulation protein
MKKAKEILRDLKQKGYRYSLAREAILDSITESKTPLSYFDIHGLLSKKKLRVNKTTVYRELAFLKEQKLIKELQFNDGVKYYELTPNNHHHHIICNNCETIDHVDLEKDLEKQEQSIFENTKFKVLSHSLEFYGLCKTCVKIVSL